MKKLIAFILACALCLSACSGFGIEYAKAYVFPESDLSLASKPITSSAPISFSGIFTYNGKVYANDRLRISGWSKVPSEAESFAIYNGYMYYLKQPDGTGVQATSLYRCSLDGTKKKLLSNKANPWNADPFIVNNTLYYNGGDDESESYNGVFSIDLGTLKNKRFLSADCAFAYYSNDYLYYYYQYNSLYRIKLNGGGKARIPSVKRPSVLYENYIYYANDGYIYRTLSDGTKKPEKLAVQVDGMWNSFNVIDDYIFCYYNNGIYRYGLDGSNEKLLTAVEEKVYYAYGFTIIGDMLYFVEGGEIVQVGNQIYTDHFYRISINGGKKEYLKIRWFTS